jgi:NAD(P)-dependent dehydrogenase (short-subunit alcohol dehydrogenase family)
MSVETTMPEAEGWMLRGKRALVTGAATGIGQGIAVALAERGADVVIHHSSTDPSETLGMISRKALQGRSIRADLAVPEECDRLIRDAVEVLGGLDILVNNAGISAEKPIEDYGAASFDAMFEVNVRAPYLTIRAAAPHLAADNGGSIVNISSVHAFAGLAPSAAYAASKGAVNAMTRTVAMELIDRRIRVNAVGPGLIETPRYFTQERVEPYSSQAGAQIVPWGRVGRPQDIGAIVAFLASDAADFITGQVIYVDGGTSSLLGIPRG